MSCYGLLENSTPLAPREEIHLAERDDYIKLYQYCDGQNLVAVTAVETICSDARIWFHFAFRFSNTHPRDVL
jgi:hypothetical protein